MPIPTYETLMLPVLNFASDHQEHHINEAVDELAELLNLSKEERTALLPSGNQKIFKSRVGWAITYLKKANILQSTKRGCFKITDRGIDVLKQKPTTLDNAFLEQYSEFKEFRKVNKEKQKEKRTRPRNIMTNI